VEKYCRSRQATDDKVVECMCTACWILRKWDVGVWTGSSWLRIGTGGGHL